MSTKTACQCIILSLVSIGVPTQVQTTAASESGIAGPAPGETRQTTKPAKPPEPGTPDPNETTRGVPPAGKAGQEPVPRDRAQEIEERVQSGR